MIMLDSVTFAYSVQMGRHHDGKALNILNLLFFIENMKAVVPNLGVGTLPICYITFFLVVFLLFSFELLDKEKKDPKKLSRGGKPLYT